MELLVVITFLFSGRRVDMLVIISRSTSDKVGNTFSFGKRLVVIGDSQVSAMW